MSISKKEFYPLSSKNIGSSQLINIALQAKSVPCYMPELTGLSRCLQKVFTDRKSIAKALSLSNISFTCYSTWLFRWMLLPLTKMKRLISLVPHLKTGIACLNIFGIAAYATKIIIDIKNFFNFMQQGNYTGINGKQHQGNTRNRYIKASFHLCGAAITILSALSFYVAPIVTKVATMLNKSVLKTVGSFASAFSGPLFTLSSGFGILKGGYCAIKNKNKLKKLEKGTKTHNYFQKKIKRNKSDIKFAAATTLSAVIFCFAPVVGSALFFGLGVAHYIIRKKQTKRIARLKKLLQDEQELTSSNLPIITPPLNKTEPMKTLENKDSDKNKLNDEKSPHNKQSNSTNSIDANHLSINYSI